jgi:hypothetical protein
VCNSRQAPETLQYAARLQPSCVASWWYCGGSSDVQRGIVPLSESETVDYAPSRTRKGLNMNCTAHLNATGMSLQIKRVFETRAVLGRRRTTFEDLFPTNTPNMSSVTHHLRQCFCKDNFIQLDLNERLAARSHKETIYIFISPGMTIRSIRKTR